MIQEYQLRIPPEIAASEQRLKTYLSQKKGLNPHGVTSLHMLKQGIDARQRTTFVNLKMQIYLNETLMDGEYGCTIYNKVENKPQVIVVGAGPGGLFTIPQLVELGLRPVVVEHGKGVRECKKDLAQISWKHWVNLESNYSFGEKGAGAYLGGKLYTRSKKRGSIDKTLNVFCQHGTSTTILVDAHPHIGMDELPRVVENMRRMITECGGEVHSEARMDVLIIEKGEVKGIETQMGKTFLGPVILATEHSARDIYRWLVADKVPIKAKGIVAGVCLEHPVELIDQIQYHNRNGRGKYLPAAEYSFITQVEGRGVYSFCIYPGGFIVPVVSGSEQMVVNEMSFSDRSSRQSSSGMMVEIQPEGITNDERLTTNDEAKGSHLELTVLRFREELEHQCWL